MKADLPQSVALAAVKCLISPTVQKWRSSSVEIDRWTSLPNRWVVYRWVYLPRFSANSNSGIMASSQIIPNTINC